MARFVQPYSEEAAPYLLERAQMRLNAGQGRGAMLDYDEYYKAVRGNVNDLLEMTLKRVKPLAQKKNIELLFESFRPVVAQIDEVKMTQVISNLVENSIKYNVEDGWVHVSLNADYQYFYIRVEDSGIGIPEESINKIFERFYRVDKARSRETGGTGLGLAIVRNIILMHHGTIKVHSEENIGTTFTMRIPLNYVENQQ